MPGKTKIKRFLLDGRIRGSFWKIKNSAGIRIMSGNIVTCGDGIVRKSVLCRGQSALMDTEVKKGSMLNNLRFDDGRRGRIEWTVLN